MLTCNDVQGALPGIVAGERDTEALREHVAACDDCRTERDRLATELGSLREELAALTPSPFLENAVLQTARETEIETRRPRISRRTWMQVGIGIAAAALLFVLRPGVDDEPTTEPAPERHAIGDGSPRVWTPPSARQVADARAKNVVDLSVIDASTHFPGMLHKPDAPGSRDKVISETFLPIDERLHHRWVYGDGAALPGRRKFQVYSQPRPGVMLVGNGLLREMDDAVVHGAVDVIVNGKHWRSTPGSAEAELTLGAPDEHGARAQVRVLVSTAYSGTILIEDTLARALGLHQFEIPGGFETSGTGTIEGQRARARVQIPELDFDKVVEVQVRKPIERASKAPAASISELHFERTVPQSITVGSAMTFEQSKLKVHGNVRGARSADADRRFQFPTSSGPLAVAMHFAPGRSDKEYVPMVAEKPPATGQQATVIAGTYDIGAPDALARKFWVNYVTLGSKDEPHARVIISRVWRGATAIPSREGVVVTNVAADGTITFPRMAGERGAKLRMLVTRKDGVSTFHDVIVNKQELTNPPQAVLIQADGTVSFKGFQFRIDDELTPQQNALALEAFLKELRKVADTEGARDAQGLSRYELRIVAEPGVRWRVVQYVMQTAAHPSVKIHKIRFGDTPYELPKDKGLADEPFNKSINKIKAKVFLKEDQYGQRVRIQIDGGMALETPAVKDGPAQLDEKHAGYLKNGIVVLKREIDSKGESLPLIGEVSAPPPNGGKIPYAVIRRIYQAFLDAGVTRVQFEGAASPRNAPPR